MKFHPVYFINPDYIPIKENINKELLETASNRNAKRSNFINEKNFSLENDSYGGFKLIYNGKRKILRNRAILEYVGYVLTEEEFRKYYNDSDKMPIYVSMIKYLGKLYYIDGGYYGNISRFINHDCKYYNTILKPMTETREKIITIYTIDDVYPGDEILLNYGTEYFSSFDRKCKCNHCE